MRDIVSITISRNMVSLFTENVELFPI